MPPRRDQSIESPPRDVGDATMQRVRGLADGWALPGDTGRLKVVLPPALPPEAPPAATATPELATGSGAGMLPGALDAAIEALEGPDESAETLPRERVEPAELAPRPLPLPAPTPTPPPPPPPPAPAQAPARPVDHTARGRAITGSDGLDNDATIQRPRDKPITAAGAVSRARPTQAALVPPAPAPPPPHTRPPAQPRSSEASPGTQHAAMVPAAAARRPPPPPLPRAGAPGAAAQASADLAIAVALADAGVEAAPPASPPAVAPGAPRAVSALDLVSAAAARDLPSGAQPLLSLGHGPLPPDATTIEPLTYGGVAAPTRGIGASIRYAAHVTLYSARRFRLLRELRSEAASKRALRTQRMTELAELALTLTEVPHKAVDARRRQLDVLADERKRRGATITKHEASLAAERAAYARHEEAAKQRNAQIADQMAGLESRLRPVERDHAGLERETDRLERENAQLGKQIASLEGKLPSGAGATAEQQRVAVEVAGLKARREAIEREAPELEARVAALAPTLEALRMDLEAAREEQNANRRDLSAKEQRMRDTCTALDTEIVRERGELERLALEAQSATRLLGEELERDRILHPRLTAAYRGVDELGGALTTLEYRIAELEKEAAGVDRAAVRRAALVLGAGALLIIALVLFLILR